MAESIETFRLIFPIMAGAVPGGVALPKMLAQVANYVKCLINDFEASMALIIYVKREGWNLVVGVIRHSIEAGCRVCPEVPGPETIQPGVADLDCIVIWQANLIVR